MQTLNLKAKGLYTHPNPLSGIPEGGLVLADNVVIDKEEVTETRRGFVKYGTALANVPKQLFVYTGRLIVNHGTTMSYDSDGVGTWVDYSGTYSPPAAAIRIRSAEANQNFYFTTTAGIKKISGFPGSIGQAGGIKALDGTAATTGASGWMTNDTQVAYRIVWGITDAKNNKIIGAPSQRILVVNNSGGTRNVDVTFTIPSGITTSHFYQIYRSAMATPATVEPNDELQLIVEKNPTGGEVAALSVTYADQTPESLRGATLYTSPSQQGIAQSNEPPPLAADITLYKTLMFYANTISKQRVTLTLISVGAPNGVQNDDTITIGGVVYTGKGAENAAAGEFLVSTGGTASQNIDATAKSLIRVINKYASNTVYYAYYLSGYTDLPGQILIEERNVGGSAVVIISSRGGAFSPTIPSAGSTYTSTNDAAKNRVYISKSEQSEAVPVANYVSVGSANYNILRIIALRDSAFVLKEEGIYRITGETINDLRVSLFDNTTLLRGIETAVPFNNRINCFTTQNVTAISDSGVSVISRPIEFDLFRLSSSQFTNFATISHGISYEADRKYIFSTLTTTTDTASNQQFVYNSVTNSWTRWSLMMACGIVNYFDGRLYYGSSDSTNKYVYQERKDFASTDYADDEWAVTVSSYSGSTVTLNSTTNAVVGYSLVQFSGVTPIRAAKITQVVNATQVVVDAIFSWGIAAAKIMKPISSSIKWPPIHGGNPEMVKLFSDLKIAINNAAFVSMSGVFTSDVSSDEDDLMLYPSVDGPWGEFPWGGVPWGGTNVNPQNIRTFVPLEKARAHWVNFKIDHMEALTSLSILGLSLFFEDTSPRQK